jgi:hypothetical protein
MKTIFTFLLIAVLAVSSFSQPNTSFPSVIENKSLSLSKVYPNPVKDIVTVELQAAVAGDIQVNLYNILGVQVKVWDSVYLSQGDQQIRLDLSLIKSGVYILKITQSGKVCSQVIKKS